MYTNREEVNFAKRIDNGIYTVVNKSIKTDTSMAPRSPLQAAKKEILQSFHDSKKVVYGYTDLSEILSLNRGVWRLGRNITVKQFTRFLEENGELHKVALLPNRIVRYTWGRISPYLLGLSLKRNSYLCHGTAVFLHGLTEQATNTIYVNSEQRPKQSSHGQLSQQGIHNAFANKQRYTSLVYRTDEAQVVLINGKFTDRLEVATMNFGGEDLSVTKLERTLIDIIVRPQYAGGVYQILQAYERAKDRISTSNLIATLKILDYAYPYHQAIGFCMERAGYEPEQYESLRALGLDYDFYLAHDLRQPDFDQSWRLYFPKGF